jgi:type I restriction enzyme S subunit
MSQIEITTLGKSCEFFNGKAHEKSIDENGKYIVVNSKFISQEGRVVKRTKEQMFPLFKGDIVMVMSDVPNGKALAKCFIIDKDDTYSLNQRICCIRSKEFDTRYLYYQLNRHEHFLAFNNGENQTNLRKDDILACPLIKPSMEQQRKISEAIDSSIHQLNNARMNVLRNIESSGELFQGHLSKIFSNEQYKFEKQELSNLCSKFIDGDWIESKDQSNSGIRLIQTGNVGLGVFKNKSGKERYISDSTFKKLKCSEIFPGDILVSRLPDPVGRTCVIPDIGKRMITAVDCTIIRLNSNLILPEYFRLYTLSNVYFNEISEKITGTTRDRISRKNLGTVRIPICSIENQLEIIVCISELENKTFALIAAYERKLNNIESLLTKIPKMAFENELIEAE